MRPDISSNHTFPNRGVVDEKGEPRIATTVWVTDVPNGADMHVRGRFADRSSVAIAPATSTRPLRKWSAIDHRRIVCAMQSRAVVALMVEGAGSLHLPGCPDSLHNSTVRSIVRRGAAIYTPICGTAQKRPTEVCISA
jgi:hypothetical protein